MVKKTSQKKIIINDYEKIKEYSAEELSARMKTLLLAFKSL